MTSVRIFGFSSDLLVNIACKIPLSAGCRRWTIPCIGLQHVFAYKGGTVRNFTLSSDRVDVELAMDRRYKNPCPSVTII